MKAICPFQTSGNTASYPRKTWILNDTISEAANLECINVFEIHTISGEWTWETKHLLWIKQAGLSEDAIQKIIQLNIHLKIKKKIGQESDS